jgi:hypothetical protein
MELKNNKHDSEPKVGKYIPCWYLPSQKGSSKILIYFHGNAEDIGNSMGLLRAIASKMDVNILAMEY